LLGAEHVTQARTERDLARFPTRAAHPIVKLAAGESMGYGRVAWLDRELAGGWRVDLHMLARAEARDRKTDGFI
jgi:hypothetical protein